MRIGLLAQKGFTIIEVLLALALMALVAGLFAVNFDVLLTSIGEKRPEKILHSAICEARYQALKEHTPMYLSFDEQSHSLVIFKDTIDKAIVAMPLKEGIRVNFELIPPLMYKGGGFKEGTHSAKKEDQIAFYPDGSSQPVIVTLEEGSFSVKYKPDPVSCAIIAV